MNLQIAVNATCLLKPMTGIARYTYNLYSEIVKRGDCEVKFLYGLSWRDELMSSMGGNKHADRVARRVLPHVRGVIKVAQKTVFDYKVRKENFTLYHEPNFLSLSFSLPVVATIHDLSILNYPDFHPKDRVRMFEKYLLKTVERSEFLLTDSDFVRKEIIDVLGVDSGKVITTHLGVDSAFYPRSHDQSKKFLKSYQLTYKAYFLVVATIEPRKNFKLVISAYLKLDAKTKQRFPLVIVGMQGWKTSQFDGALENLKKKGYLRMLGYVPNDALPVLYSSAKIFLYPSLYEGFGLPPLEAMACGTPVITSDASSLPEVVGDAGVTVSPHDDVALKDAIIMLLEDDNVLAGFSRKSIDRAKLFTWEKCAEKTISIYRRVQSSANYTNT